MITDCFGVRFWSFEDAELVFVEGTAFLLKFVAPTAIAFGWRKFQKEKDRPQRVVSVLGIESSNAD